MVWGVGQPVAASHKPELGHELVQVGLEVPVLGSLIWSLRRILVAHLEVGAGVPAHVRTKNRFITHPEPVHEDDEEAIEIEDLLTFALAGCSDPIAAADLAHGGVAEG